MMRAGQMLFTYFHFAADEAPDPGRHRRAASPPSPTRRSSTTPGRLPLADADERGRRPDEHPAGGEVPRTAPGGPGHPAGRRARRAPRPRSRSSAAASSARTPPRSPPGSGPTSASWTSTSTGSATSTTSCRRTSRRSIPTATRSCESIERADLVDRRHPDPRRPGPPAGPTRRPEADEARLGDRRRGDRPGGLRRDQPADDPPEPDLHRRRRRPLLRHQHARRRRPHQHLCPLQRDACPTSSGSPRGLADRRRSSPGVAQGSTCIDGRVTNRAVAETFGLPYHPLRP